MARKTSKLSTKGGKFGILFKVHVFDEPPGATWNRDFFATVKKHDIVGYAYRIFPIGMLFQKSRDF
jgi:hypothetical protein